MKPLEMGLLLLAAALAGALGGSCVVFMRPSTAPAASPLGIGSTIRVQGLEIVDRASHVRLRLKLNEDDEPGIVMFDPAGNPSTLLYDAGLALSEAGTMRVALAVVPKVGGAIQLYDAAGTARTTLGFSPGAGGQKLPGLFINDERQQSVVTISEWEAGAILRLGRAGPKASGITLLWNAFGNGTGLGVYDRGWVRWSAP